jgi:hypothetical protein
MEIALEGTSLVEQFRRTLVADFEQKIDEWCRCRKLLFEWENENLLDNPSVEQLAKHKERLDLMIFFGQLFSLATSHPTFPRTDLAEQVQATLWILRDQYKAFHGPRMTPAETDRILAAVFPDEHGIGAHS